MGKFKHTNSNTIRNSVLLYEFKENVIKASFYFKEKPKVGDLFETSKRRETNFCWTYKIEEIMEQRDSAGVYEDGFELHKDSYIVAKVKLLNEFKNGRATPIEGITELRKY